MSACHGADEGLSEPPTQRPAVLFPFAAAVDPGCDCDAAQVGEAVAAAFEAWQSDDTAFGGLNQGVSAQAPIADDGLQVVWLWWGAVPWPYDPAAVVVEQTWERSGQTGFDLIIRGPACPGEDLVGDAAFLMAITNAVSRGIGKSQGIIPEADASSPLAQEPCGVDIPLNPSQAERAAMAQRYPR